MGSGRVSMKSPQTGFSFFELLIVVAIILIIAAIAIPNLLRSRMAANEASAVSSVRTINTAEVTYSATFGIGYRSEERSVGRVTSSWSAPSANAWLIEQVLGRS